MSLLLCLFFFLLRSVQKNWLCPVDFVHNTVIIGTCQILCVCVCQSIILLLLFSCIRFKAIARNILIAINRWRIGCRKFPLNRKCRIKYDNNRHNNILAKLGCLVNRIIVPKINRIIMQCRLHSICSVSAFGLKPPLVDLAICSISYTAHKRNAFVAISLVSWRCSEELAWNNSMWVCVWFRSLENKMVYNFKCDSNYPITTNVNKMTTTIHVDKQPAWKMWFWDLISQSDPKLYLFGCIELHEHEHENGLRHVCFVWSGTIIK